MSAEDNGQRISLSRETLRAELLDLELRLVDRLTAALSTKADSAVVEQIDQRVAQLELARASREHLANDVVDAEKRITRLERFRYAIPSAAVIAAFVALGQFAYYLTR